jgi:hypothetical protein
MVASLPGRSTKRYAAAAAGESEMAMKVRLSPCTPVLDVLRIENPEFGETGELFAGRRS